MSTRIQCVVLGTGAVGKSACTINYVKKIFVDEYDPTIEDAYSKLTHVDGVGSVVLDILDTAGQEEYSAMRDQYMQEGEGFILVYAINNRDSFDEIVEFAELVSRIKDKNCQDIPLVLMGNKADLPSDEREVDESDGAELAERLNCPFFETSAFTGKNVDETFRALIDTVLEQRAVEEEREKKNDKKQKQKNKIANLKKTCKML